MLTVTVSGRTYDFSHAVGGYYITQPVGVATGEGDLVYVLSRQSEQVSNVAWNRTATGAKIGQCTIGTIPGDEKFLGDISKYGDGDGQLIWPAGIATDTRKNIYVTDEWMNRVSIFDKEGAFLNSWGSPGSGDGEFNRPSGIAVDQQGDIYIVDSLNHRVQKFTKDGKHLNAWGSLGNGDGQFDSPWGIAIDEQGHVYVADHRNHRVQKFTPEGEYVSQFGSYGTGRGQLDRPAGVAVDSDGDVYVCDWGNSQVQIFGPDGRFITSLIGDAQVPSKWHMDVIEANADVAKARRRVYTLEPEWRFAFPTAAVFDEEKSRLLVADTQRGRLQIYNKVRGYLEPQFNL